MVYFDLTVEKQQIFGADKINIAADANKTICFRFHFDGRWRIFDEKAAIFKNCDGEYYIIEIKGDKAVIPWEVLTQSRSFDMSVIGYENEMVLTTKKVSVLVSESLLPGDYKTFAASETLFDRFKKECKAQAFLDYEDEIKSLKASYEETIMSLSEKIAESGKKAEEIAKEKDKEIEELNIEHSSEIKTLNSDISEINAKLEAAMVKADKWDCIDTALSYKELSSNALWGGANQVYKLPMLNTCSVKSFSYVNFDKYISEIGLDLSSAEKFEEIFSSNNNLKKVQLINTQNVQSMLYAFASCKSLKRVDLGDLDNCNSMFSMFSGDTSIEYVSFGKSPRAVNCSSMFNNCMALKTIDGILNMMLCTTLDSMFNGCSSLETVRFEKNTIRKSIDFRSCINLTEESILSIVNGLSDEVSMSLYLSNFAFERIFPTLKEQDEILDIIMEEKGWAVAFI